MEKDDQGESRRELIVAVGAAAGLLPVVGSAVGALESAEIRERPWWVRTVEKPTLGETNDDYQRFGGRNIFSLYRELKDEREGEGAFKVMQKEKRARVTRWMRDGKPGYGLRDRALEEAGWTVMRSSQAGAKLLSWNRLRAHPPKSRGVEPYTASPEEMASTVKAAARLYGAALVGIAPLNESYVNRKARDRAIVFKDVDAPEVTEKEYVIPKKMKWAVSIAIQMDLDLLTRCPTALGKAATTLGYSQCAFVVATLAEFIRGLGYEAIPSVNDTAQSIPFAIDAGLGELSRTNRLITPEFGPCVRLCKVFTDMPMAYDKPIDFGVVEFCKRCKKCAEACPSDALSFDDEPSFETKGPWNNPGHKAWYEDSYRCYTQWQEGTTGCTVCFAACPYTKADKAWVHEIVKASSSVAPGLDPFFRVMDDAFGYGRQHDPESWWAGD